MGAPKKYDKDFFKTWSRDMAYVLGFLYADGNIVRTKRGNHYIALYTADRPILAAMRRSMKAQQKISARQSATGRVYRIQIGSKEWFADIGTLGLVPNKIRRLRLPDVPQEFFGDFVRGYFDGDGNVWVGKIHKDRKTSHIALLAFFTSGSHGYLLSLLAALRARGIQGGSLHKLTDKDCSRLTLSIKDALKLYEIMYNKPHKLFLGRKKRVFERFIKMRP